MTLDELTPWLFARVSGGIRWGLERTERLLAGVGNPHRLFRSVLIGGTNGKGSVAAMCDAALRADGRRRVGLYTSPHLISLAERIRVNGKPIDEELLAAAARRLRPAIEESGASFFEATTAMAFLLLAEAEVDVAVVEVGLGGRLDSTNVLQPMVTAVTNVSTDHQEYLGETLEEIAYEKAGIFKPGVPAVVGEQVPGPEAVLKKRAEEVGAPYYRLDDLVTICDIGLGLESTRVHLSSRRWGELDLEVPLPGRHQARNVALAVEVLGLLPEEYRPRADELRRGIGTVRWPGRLQVERIGGLTWTFDVAHNEAGAAALGEWLDKIDLPRPRVGLVAILSDKDWRRMLRELTGRLDAIVLTVAPSSPMSRRWDPNEAARWITGADNASRPVLVVLEFAEALRGAGRLADGGSVVVTGSVHTVGDAMAALGMQVG